MSKKEFVFEKEGLRSMTEQDKDDWITELAKTIKTIIDADNEGRLINEEEKKQ